MFPCFCICANKRELSAGIFPLAERCKLREGLKELSLLGKFPLVGEKVGDFFSNVLQLPGGGDFEALHFQLNTNFDRSTKLDLTAEPPLLGRCCYRIALIFSLSTCVSFDFNCPFLLSLSLILNPVQLSSVTFISSLFKFAISNINFTSSPRLKF